jgi:ketosteroid isomerase-like protein
VPDEESASVAAGAECRRLVAQFWQLMNANDFHGAGQLLHDDYVLEFPQSSERIRGRDNFVAFNEEYPAAGPWSFDIRRQIVEGSHAVTEVIVSDTVVVVPAISFFEIRDGRIWRMTEYWPDPMEAPAMRAHLVEAIE